MRTFVVLGLLSLSLLPAARAETTTNAPGAVPQGLRVFTAGHSFHFFLPLLLELTAEADGIKGHQIAGLSAIGGAPINAHWLVPEDQNKLKAALQAGQVDVLTLSSMWLPDVGIEHFAKLAVAHNPRIRITIQEFWLPNDVYEPVYPVSLKKKVDHNAVTIPELRQRHEPYFKDMDDEVRRLNHELGKTVLYVVPVGQAVLALRDKVVKGEVPGIATQADLFHDPVGHPQAPIQLLEAYCHFAVIYQTSPVGLPPLETPHNAKFYFDQGLWTLPLNAPPLSRYKEADKLNRLVQELAWEAVTHHPLSGVHP